MKVVTTEQSRASRPARLPAGHILRGSPSRGSLHPQVQQLERSIGLKDLAMADLEQKVHEMEASTFDGVFIWKISDFARKRQEAVAGRTPAIFSPGEALELSPKLLLSCVPTSPPGQSALLSLPAGRKSPRHWLQPLVTAPHLSTCLHCGAARRGSCAGGVPTPALPGCWLSLHPLWELSVSGHCAGPGVGEGACRACVAAHAPVRPAASS